MYSPTREEFQKLAAQGNLIPVTRQLLADVETPLSAYRKIRGAGESFLFESVEGGEHLGRYSFVGCNPRAVIRQVGQTVEVIENGKVVETFGVQPEAGMGGPASAASLRDGLAAVERVMKQYRAVPVPGLPRFTGGAVGFIGYEFIHDVEPVVPRPPQDDLQTPVIYFLIADQLLIFDRVAQTITVLVNAVLSEASSPAEAYEEATDEIDRLISLLEQPTEHRPVTVPREVPPLPFASNLPRETFLANVLKAKQYITSGDIIQVVGSQRFSAPVKASPLDVYRAARSINPSPYMFLLELDGFSLVGASPEIHVRCEEGRVEIRPIAGTRRRGASPEEDLALEKELLADPKERAEHVMLVDLARNDLGRVCDFGSVQVKDLMTIERYSHVMHIVSQVEGRLAADKTPYDLMRATFPAGTLSGAPKIRAMQIIAELEQTARGPYGGCVGYFSFNGNLDCCITIRTALIKDGRAWVQAGGGWVNDSTPEGEYQETVNKSKAMLKAVGHGRELRRLAGEAASTPQPMTSAVNREMNYTVGRAGVAPRFDAQWQDPVWEQASMLDVEHFRPESSDHHPVTTARMLYDERGIYGIFRVQDRYVRCLRTEYHDPVWKDSCVEFFAQPKPDHGYFNFEFNCGGAFLCCHITNAEREGDWFKEFVKVPAGIGQTIRARPSLPPRIEPEITEPVVWTLSFFIPFALIERYVGPLGALPGQVWRGNFFKCSEENSHPHWASWSPVDEFNFHRPNCFGSLMFA